MACRIASMEGLGKSGSTIEVLWSLSKSPSSSFFSEAIFSSTSSLTGANPAGCIDIKSTPLPFI